MKKLAKHTVSRSPKRKITAIIHHKFTFIFIGLFILLSLCAFSLLKLKIEKAKASSSPIQHIVLIMKENHSFDHYFGAYPGVNGTTTGKIKVNGAVQTIPLNPFQDIPNTDFNHGFPNAQQDYDNGAMDHFNQGPCATAPYPCYQEAQRSDLPNYWQYADTYVLNDNTFPNLRGPSYPNHLYTVAGAAGPTATESAIGNPSNAKAWGCDSPATTTVKLFNGTTQFPCVSLPTIADAMTNAGVTWKYYAPQQNEPGYIWNSLDAVKQDRNGPAWKNDVPWQQFATDVQNNTLPQFSWLIAPGPLSEHPSPSTSTSYGNSNSMCAGENWTVQQINMIMSNPNLWPNTAIILTWDDWGGYYDHVAPQNINQLGYGIRVPFLVISPYAAAVNNPSNPHVSHDLLSFGSVLKFAEETFNVPSLGKADATDPDLLSQFDFTQVHNPALVLPQRTCSGVTPTPSSAVTPTNTVTPTISPTGVPSTPTPTPVSGSIIARDTFQRANQQLWGIASDGQAWTGDANTQSGFAISNNTGQIQETVNTNMNALLGPVVSNGEVVVSGAMSTISGNNSLGAAVRWNSSSNFYKALINGGSLVIQKNVNGAVTVLATVPFKAVANTPYTIRFNASGTTLAAKAWQTGTIEPSSWMASVTDSSIASGKSGIRMLQQAGTTTTISSFTATMQ